MALFMDDVRISTPRNRLAKILEGIGGRTIADMSSDAESRVAVLAGAIRKFAAAQVAEIMEIHRQGEIAMFSESRRVSSLAMNIAETAGAGQMHPLGEAARGVCAMIDALIADGVWHTEALEAHLNALVLFSCPHAPGEKEMARVVARLSELRAAVGITD